MNPLWSSFATLASGCPQIRRRIGHRKKWRLALCVGMARERCFLSLSGRADYRCELRGIFPQCRVGKSGCFGRMVVVGTFRRLRIHAGEVIDHSLSMCGSGRKGATAIGRSQRERHLTAIDQYNHRCVARERLPQCAAACAMISSRILLRLIRRPPNGVRYALMRGGSGVYISELSGSDHRGNRIH